MTEKVIEFPKHKVVREVPANVLEERNRRAEQKTADTIVDEITGYMITELDNYYVDVQDKQFTKDFVLVVDALKAAVYRSFGFEHHLHQFVDENVKLIDGDMSELTNDEIKEKIESIMQELNDAKDKIDNLPDE